MKACKGKERDAGPPSRGNLKQKGLVPGEEPRGLFPSKDSSIIVLAMEVFNEQEEEETKADNVMNTARALP